MCQRLDGNFMVEIMAPMVSRLDGLFQLVYSLFYRNNKKHIELVKLANLMETKDKKMLHNVKIRWISMKNLALQILLEYKALLVKFGVDLVIGLSHKVVARAVGLFESLSNIEVLL